VAELVADQFPDLAGAPVCRFGAGWDHDLFLVGAEWILRFPKRAEGVAWLAREIQVIAIAAETLGSSIPVFERRGTPSAIFPYPFVGYRRLPGVAAGQASVRDLGGLAGDIGRLLGRLHRIDPRRIPPTPAGWEQGTWAQLRTGLMAVGQVVRPLLAPSLLAEAEPYLAGSISEPAQDGPRRFIHNDICPDHLIVNAGNGRLAGLIDFTDATVGEIVLDFAGLIGVGGYDFISQVVSCYDLPVGSHFGKKLRWLARTLTLTWLAEAADHDPGDAPQHLLWVARAFGH
jgi:aminoglycoside phosphotransferase (APT) family kinase protein